MAGFNHNSATAPDEPQWSAIDLTRLPDIAFADEANRSYPHHWIRGGGNPDEAGRYTTGEMFLHKGGLNAAWAAAQGARSGQKASDAIIAHLEAHRKALAPSTGSGQAAQASRTAWALGPSADSGRARELGTNLFEKELIRVGRWRHPQGRFTLDVDSNRLRTWVEAFSRMRAAGVSVPVPYGHSYDARDNAGFIEALRVEGDKLVGVIRAPRDDDAQRLGATATEVSISLNPDFVAGDGTRFGEVIEHVAITNYPVVQGQGNFEKIAADAAGGRVEIITLTQEDEGMKDGEKGKEPPEGATGGGGESPEKIALARETAEKTRLVAENQALRKRIELARKVEVATEIDGLMAKGKIPASDDAKHAARALLLADGDGAGKIHMAAKGADGKDGEVELTPADAFRKFMAHVPDGAIVKLGRLTGASGTTGGKSEDEAATDAARQILEAGGYEVKKKSAYRP